MKKGDLSRFRPRFGVGTLIAIIAIALLWFSGALRPPPQSKPTTDLKTIYEADRSGKLHPVEPSSTAPKPPPLVIKEPSLLLNHADDLKLSDAQRKRIEGIARQWERERDERLQEMKQLQSDIERSTKAQAGDKVAYSQLQQGLNTYSALSRELADRRSAAWSEAVSILADKQRKRLQTFLTMDEDK